MLERLNENEFVRKHGWGRTLLLAAVFLVVSAVVIDPLVVDPIVGRIPTGDSIGWLVVPWLVIALVWWITIRGLRKGEGDGGDGA